MGVRLALCAGARGRRAGVSARRVAAGAALWRGALCPLRADGAGGRREPAESGGDRYLPLGGGTGHLRALAHQRGTGHLGPAVARGSAGRPLRDDGLRRGLPDGGFGAAYPRQGAARSGR